MLSRKGFLQGLGGTAVLFAVTVCGQPKRACLGVDKDAQTIRETNLWQWPTDWATSTSYRTPTTVWTPEIGRWYGSFAVSGYVNSNRQGSFGEDYLVNAQSSAGYSMACFVALPSGKYRLSYRCSLASYCAVVKYRPSGDGFVYDSRKTATFPVSRQGGELSFVAEDGCIYALVITPSERNIQDTFRDISIVREGGRK